MAKISWDYQQPEFYRFSSDSLFLVEQVYALMKQSPPKSILDVGAGCGVVGLELAQRFSDDLESVTLLEPLPDFQLFLKMNLEVIETQVSCVDFKIVQENILNTQVGLFDLVVSNPPYFLSERGRSSPNPLKNHCRMFQSCSPQEFFQPMQKRLKPKGLGFFLGHKDVWGEGDWEIVARFKEVCLYRFFSVSNCR